MNPNFMQTLAWSLLHFLWQGAAIAALAAALMYVFRKPATRYVIGIGALALMMLSFAVTFALLNDTSELPAAATAARAPAAVLVPPGTHAASEMPWTGEHAATNSPTPPSPLDFAWVARGWLLGVFILALRIAFGLFVIEQLRRRNLVALPDALVERFQALQARLGITRAIRYAECGLVNVPAVIGFFRPVVLIPVRALTGLSAEQLEALIAHELGHIKRFDVAVNFAQVVAETLFFFHPAVWWLNKRIRADREDCCDDIAVSAGGSSVGYAKALATIANWREVPSFAMAATGGPVAARIARLLGVKRDGSGAAGVFTAAVILAGALSVGAVSLGFVEPANAQTTDKPSRLSSETGLPAPVAPPAPASPPSAVAAVPAAIPSPASVPAAAARPAPASRPVAPIRAAPAAPAAPAARPAKPTAPDEVEVENEVEATVSDEPEVRNDVSFIEEMRQVVGEVDADQLVALKVHGVTPKYINQLRSRGIQASVDEIIAMKSQGITPDYIKQVRAMGFDASTDEIISFKVQGISPEFVQQVRSMGFDASADEILAFKVHGISPAFVQQVRSLGFNASADDIVAMKIQGVSSEYVKQMRDLGLKFSADEVIAMRVHDISPDYVKQMRANGFDADTDQLIAMRVHDVTPEYRRKLAQAGFKLDVDELVQAKVMDITPEFISKVSSHGFKNLDIDQLIALKNANVL